MKPGDLLYTIYEDENWSSHETTLQVKVAEVVSVGPKRVRIRGVNGERAGLAFGCASQLSITQAERYGRTEKAAWLVYYERLGRKISECQRELARLCTLQQRAAEKVR